MSQEVNVPVRLTKAELLKNTPIFQDTYITAERYRQDAAFARLYTSEILEMDLIAGGSGIHQVLGQTIPCKEGDIFIVKPDVPHGFFLTEESESLTVRRLLFHVKDWFETDVSVPEHPRYCYGVFRDSTIIAYAVLNSKTLKEINERYDAIAWELFGRRSEWQDAVRSQLALLLISLSRYVNGAIKNVTAFPAKEWSLVASTLKTVAEQFHENEMTLESIALSYGISKSYLSRLFRRLTGKGFSDHVRELRLGHACRLLAGSEMTVEEIVEQCGLKDVPSFYQSFHSYMGMTPNQYRTRQREEKIFINKGEKIMSILNEISENLQIGKAKIVKELVQKALDEGCAPADILNQGLLSGMSIVGEKFKNNEVYVPEVLVAARAMNMGVAILKPHLVADGVQATGRVCIGTVQGDLHDIGKNLVRMMMEGKGLDVVDLGVDVSPETFVKTAIEQNCQVICCSALLTTTMGTMSEVVKAVEAAGVHDKVKVMIGGAPVTEDFRREIGADCYTSDAASAADAAVEICKSLA